MTHWWLVGVCLLSARFAAFQLTFDLIGHLNWLEKTGRVSVPSSKQDLSAVVSVLLILFLYFSSPFRSPKDIVMYHTSLVVSRCTGLFDFQRNIFSLIFGVAQAQFTWLNLLQLIFIGKKKRNLFFLLLLFFFFAFLNDFQQCGSAKFLFDFICLSWPMKLTRKHKRVFCHQIWAFFRVKFFF